MDKTENALVQMPEIYVIISQIFIQDGYFLKGLAFFLTAIFTASFASASVQEGRDLFERKCDGCPSLECSLSAVKNLEGWKSTAGRMANRSEGLISESDAVKIAGYLDGRHEVEKAEKIEKEVDKESGEVAKIERNEIFNFKKVRVNQFIEPPICGECHSEIYEQWSGSMHSKAFADPLWRAATKLFFKEAVTEGQILEMKACVECHTPLGVRSYSITSPKDDYDKLAGLPAEGIFCNWCHNISELKHIGDEGYEVTPGGGEDDPSTMLGPFKDSNSDFHPTKYSELHTRSEFCGLCHNVSHSANKLPIEATYDEWKNSPYNTENPETSINCQDCHMRQRPGIPSTGKTGRPDNPGKASDNGPDRGHIWTHYFVGANAVATRLLGGGVNAQMAVERLKNAADLELIKSPVYKKKEISYIKVKVINSGAGHYLPTGLTQVRQMWLGVTITDAAGKMILKSGGLDKNGDIDKEAVLYYTQLGNEKGEPVTNVALADRVLYEHRIPPKGYAIEKYAFIIPPGAVSPLKIEATLKYRSISQSLAVILLGEGAPEISVIDMASLVDTIEF